MSAASYTMEVVTAAGPVVVAVRGELDVTNTSDFVESMEKLPGARPLVLDLSAVVYLDSAGLATLDRLTGTNSAVVVIPVTSPVSRAAELMDLPRHATVEEAVKAAGGD